MCVCESVVYYELVANVVFCSLSLICRFKYSANVVRFGCANCLRWKIYIRIEIMYTCSFADLKKQQHTMTEVKHCKWNVFIDSSTVVFCARKPLYCATSQVENLISFVSGFFLFLLFQSLFLFLILFFFLHSFNFNIRFLCSFYPNSVFPFFFSLSLSLYLYM